MATRPNVVLICVDQWRGDCLGIDGHPVVHTPYLDQMALGGVRFSRAYSSCPTCIAARAALFTGLSQRTHGRVGYQDGVPWNYPVTLAGEFTRHGYQTQAIGKMHVHPARSQTGFQNVILHDGFLHFGRRRDRNPDLSDDYLPWLREQLGRDADYFEHGLNCNSLVTRPWDKDEYLHPTNWVAHQSIDFLRRRDPAKPFFLFMSFHRPHPPYDPPAWALEQYLARDIPDPPVGKWAGMLDEYMDSHNPECMVGVLPKHLIHRARAGYYGHMSHIDHQINRFLESLHEYGVGGNTVVCFTSDHGELLGDHHLYRKSFGYEGSARVPLILRAPPEVGFAKGAALDPAVELRDLLPTLLDCAGLPIPQSVEGRSLLPLARGQKPPEWRLWLHGEHLIWPLRQSQHWLTDGKEKYLWFSGTGHEQLFDLTRDPQELHDLASTAPDRVAVWRSRLVQELNGREEGYTDGQTLIPGRPARATLSHILPQANQTGS